MVVGGLLGCGRSQRRSQVATSTIATARQLLHAIQHEMQAYVAIKKVANVSSHQVVAKHIELKLGLPATTRVDSAVFLGGDLSWGQGEATLGTQCWQSFASAEGREAHAPLAGFQGGRRAGHTGARAHGPGPSSKPRRRGLGRRRERPTQAATDRCLGRDASGRAPFADRA